MSGERGHLFLAKTTSSSVRPTKRAAKILPDFSGWTASPSPRDGAGNASRWHAPPRNIQGKMIMADKNNDVLKHPKINPNNVPKAFHSLIPYVEKWGISDDGYLDEEIDGASSEEIKELIKVISEFKAEGFDKWLGNPNTDNYTKEWVAFVSLINAYDLAKIRLKLEIDEDV
ncbi:MAG: hypothetical protein J0L96_02445 [Anaerolineae bacterium]|nr:hypothetical protein [Anaerolineae bacterium]